MKEVLIALWMGILSLFGVSAPDDANMLGGGPGTINQLDQWKSTSTPSAITQNVYGKPILITGLDDGCVELLNGLATTTTGLPCGSGSGGGGLSTTSPFTAGDLVQVVDDGTVRSIATSSLGITSSQWTTNGSNIYYNTGNVGIGTSTPASKLTIYQSAYTSAGGITFDSVNGGAINNALYRVAASQMALRAGGNDVFFDAGDIRTSSGPRIRGAAGASTTPTYAWNGDPNTGMYNPSADALGFSTAGLERLRINSSGNFGIGTTTPSQRLTVAGTSSATAYTIPGIADGCATWASSFLTTTGSACGSGGGGLQGTIPPGQVAFGSTTSGYLDSSSNLFWSTSTNRLGIGISVPTRTLDLYTGDMYLEGDIQTDDVSSNTFLGVGAGQTQTFNGNNTLIGNNAGYSVSANSDLTAIGANAAYSGGGSSGTHVGAGAGYTSANSGHTFIGTNAGRQVASYSSQTAVGAEAMRFNNGGANNAAFGWWAGRVLADGFSQATAFSGSTYLGDSTKVSANSVSNETAIGYDTIGNGSNSVTLGNSSVTKTVLRGNVGIGTTTPTTPLHVIGTTTTDVLCLSADTCRTTWPSGGAGGGLATSSPWTNGDLAYVTGAGTVGSVATGTVSAGTGLAVTAGRAAVGGALAISADTGYNIPLTASTTHWASFYDLPSSRITDGDALTWAGNTLNFDGGATPGGSLGGTWASPTIDDLFLLNNGDSGTGNYSFSGGTFTVSGTTTLATTTIAGPLTILGETITNFTTYVRSLFSAGAGLAYSAGQFAVDLAANFAWTGQHDFGGATFLEIPNGTNPTANDPGEIAHDTSDNQLIMDDFVVGKGVQKIWGVTIASTSPAFINASLVKIPTELDGYTMTAIRCSVQGGTNKVIAVEDESGNSTEDITCTTSVTSDDGSITNATATAAEEMYIDFGATSGSVDYVSITVFGTWTRE